MKRLIATLTLVFAMGYAVGVAAEETQHEHPVLILFCGMPLMVLQSVDGQVRSYSGESMRQFQGESIETFDFPGPGHPVCEMLGIGSVPMSDAPEPIIPGVNAF